MENQSQIKINLNQYSYIIKLEEQRENNIFGPIYKLEKILRDNRSVKYTWTCQLIKKNELSVQKQNEFQKLYQLYKKNQFDRENGCLIQVQDEPVLSDTQNNVYIYEYFKKRIYTYIEEEFQQKFKSVNSDMLKPLIKRIILCYKALYDKKQNLNKDVQPQLQNLIIHGNITPENIVSNSQGQIKIKGYFGNQINDVFLQNLNRSKKFWRAYLAPEIFTNLNSIIIQNKNSHALEKIDIYALGVIFYRILYQQLPKFDPKTKLVIFSQENKNEKQQNVSNIESILKKLIQKCLSHNPADRLNAQQLFTFLETKEINFIQPTENLFANKEENSENKEIIKIVYKRNQAQFLNKILCQIINKKNEFQQQIKVSKQNLTKYIFILAEKQRLILNQILEKLLQIKQDPQYNNLLLVKNKEITQIENIVMNEIINLEDYIEENNFKLNIVNILHNQKQLRPDEKIFKEYLQMPIQQDGNLINFQHIYEFQIAILIDKMGILQEKVIQDSQFFLGLQYQLILANFLEEQCYINFEKQQYFDFKLFYETVPQLGNAILIKRISEKMKDNFKRMKQLERKKVIIQ